MNDNLYKHTKKYTDKGREIETRAIDNCPFSLPSETRVVKYCPQCNYWADETDTICPRCKRVMK